DCSRTTVLSRSQRERRNSGSSVGNLNTRLIGVAVNACGQLSNVRDTGGIDGHAVDHKWTCCNGRLYGGVVGVSARGLGSFCCRSINGNVVLTELETRHTDDVENADISRLARSAQAPVEQLLRVEFRRGCDPIDF